MPNRHDYADGQFSWIDLTARDIQDAQDFYGMLFGWECVEVDTQGGPPYARFQLQGESVAGIAQVTDPRESEDTPAVWNSYLRVDSAEEVSQRAVQLGGVLVMPVMKVLEAGWMSVIQDPTGARVGLWQANQHSGAERIQDIHCFCWTELCTHDTAKAREFYSKLLGWEFLEHEMPTAEYHVIENHGQQNGGVMLLDERWGAMPPCWLVYFAVANVDFAVDQLRQLGGTVFVAPFDIPEGRMAMVTDRQGAMFNLVQMDAPDQ